MRTPRGKILIVDPIKNLLDIYRMFLEEEQYEVETASSLSVASQKLSLDHYGVLISEYLPPFEETLEMLHHVKEHSPETYIVIVTNAIVDEEAYERLFNAGIDDLILKPYSPNKILVHVRKGFRSRYLILKAQELEIESLVDPLTRQVGQSVFNLAHFRKCLRQEWKKARRHGRTFSLILMEVPDEVTIRNRNQLEGMMVEMLRTLRRNTREEDIVGRGNGGFGLLLPETDEVGSKAVARRLTNLVKDFPPFQRDESVRSTTNLVSFQVFTYPEKFMIPESLRSALEELS
jgi:PleD family two-component response regulator